MLRALNLPTFATSDYEKEKIQQNVGAVLNPLLNIPVVNGNLITSLVVPASLILTVPHGLGRVPLGYFVVSASGDYGNPPWSLSGDQTNATRNLILRFSSGAGVTLKLWVF